MEKLDELFNALDTINMLMHLHHRSDSEYDRWLLAQYSRYSSAVHELIYIQAEGIEEGALEGVPAGEVDEEVHRRVEHESQVVVNEKSYR